MQSGDPTDLEVVIRNIRALIQSQTFRISVHAHQEMAEEDISLEAILEAIDTGTILENYPHHRRGSCCLVHGLTRAGRNLHIVCTTIQPLLVIITVYVPLPPKWVTPTQRGRRT
jgi:hypothetical protein